MDVVGTAIATIVEFAMNFASKSNAPLRPIIVAFLKPLVAMIKSVANERNPDVHTA